MIISYLDQLYLKCRKNNIDMKNVRREANMPWNIYLRYINKSQDIGLKNALKLNRAIERLIKVKISNV